MSGKNGKKGSGGLFLRLRDWLFSREKKKKKKKKLLDISGSRIKGENVCRVGLDLQQPRVSEETLKRYCQSWGTFMCVAGGAIAHRLGGVFEVGGLL